MRFPVAVQVGVTNGGGSWSFAMISLALGGAGLRGDVDGVGGVAAHFSVTCVGSVGVAIRCEWAEGVVRQVALKKQLVTWGPPPPPPPPSPPSFPMKLAE